MNIEDIKVLARDVLYGPDTRAEWVQALQEDPPHHVRYYQFLYSLSARLKPKGVVETGSRWGYSAAQMAAGSYHSTIVTLDLNATYLQRNKRSPLLERFPNIVWLFGDSRKLKNRVLEHVSRIDILYLDSAHEYDIVSEEYRLYAPLLRPGGVLVVDDINFNEGLRRFWGELEEPKVALNELHDLRAIHGDHQVGFGVAVKPEL